MEASWFLRSGTLAAAALLLPAGGGRAEPGTRFHSLERLPTFLELSGMLPAAALQVGPPPIPGSAPADTVLPDLPGSAIGIVSVGEDIDGNDMCTGSLVSRFLVLTAGHCVIVPREKAGSVYFWPSHDWRNEGNEKFLVEKVLAMGKSRGGSQDWAIIKLKEPAGDKYGWLKVSPNTQNFIRVWNVTFVGYTGNTGYTGLKYRGEHPGKTAQIRISGCVLAESHTYRKHYDYWDDRVWEHACLLSLSGGSGGPLLSQTGSIVGIASAFDPNFNISYAVNPYYFYEQLQEFKRRGL